MSAGDIIVVNENSFGMKANYYDGTDDYMLADAHAVARVAAGDTVGTYTAWIYRDDVTTEQNILSAGDNNSVTEFLQFRVLAGKIDFRLDHIILNFSCTHCSYEIFHSSYCSFPVSKMCCISFFYSYCKFIYKC